MRNRLCFIGFIFFVFHVICLGQKISFTGFTTEQGLSQNTVLTIAQDKQGFMWFGTRHGLNRYDGYKFVTYTYNPKDSFSISDNYINDLYFDSTSGLWVATNEGLNKFDPVKNRFERIKVSVEKWKYPNIVGFAHEGKGKFWVMSFEGLYLAENSNNKFTAADKLGILSKEESRGARAVLRDTKGYLWVATKGKLLRLKQSNGQIDKKEFYYNENATGSISDEYVTTIYEDKKGRIWVGTLNGLNLYDPGTQNFHVFKSNPANNSSLTNNNIRAISEDLLGRLWVGTQDGLSILDVGLNNFSSYRYNPNDKESISQNSIHSIYRDISGSMWVGTFYSGVNISYNPYINTPLVHNRYVFPALSSNIISSIAIDQQENIWIGTEGGGLNYVNKKNNAITVFKNEAGKTGGPSSNLIKKIYIDGDKNLWVGTHGGGLNVLTPGSHSFKYVLQHLPFMQNRHAEVVALLEDSEKIFWVGAHQGLYAFTKSGIELLPSVYQPALDALLKKDISVLYEDKNNNIWIGTLKGLYIFHRKLKKLLPVNISHEKNNINCITEDSMGNIWIGINYGGLARFDKKQNAVVPVMVEGNLPNQNIVGILEDRQHNLWISTGNGLVRYNPQNGVVRSFTTSDGLVGNEFNHNAFLRHSTGEMFFGGMKGLFSFYPDDVKINNNKLPIVLTGLTVFNSPVTAGDSTKILNKDINYINQLVLKHNSNTFAINFSLLNYIKPDKNSYAYKLKEVHDDWIRTETPVATFTNLAPGNYTLLVKGANNDGVWSEPRVLKITVLPPFWATWWAYVIYAFIILATLFFIVRFFYLRALLSRDKELNELKLNFFTNISHEIRTHLTLIKAPVEKIEQENNTDPGLRRHVSHLKQNADRLLNLVNELMDFRKAESNSMRLRVKRHELIGFLSSVYESFEELAQSKNIQISFLHNVHQVFVYFDNEQMGKVIYNLLTNAFKFTPNGGRINLYVEERQNDVLINITDNGRGIDEQYIHKIFTNYFQVDDSSTQNTGYGIGLALCRAIVSLHKGLITVKSVKADGTNEGNTCFTITLLKGSAHFSSHNLLPQEDGFVKEAYPTIIQHPIDENDSKQTADNVRYNILVIEDNEAIRELICDTLSDHIVATCENGKMGWDVATQTIPELIISDVMMPEMDGITLTQKLKTDHRTSHIPIILLTAKTTQTDQVTGLKYGADLYLTKPFSTEILKLSVQNILAAREKMRKKFSNEFTIAPRNTVIPSADGEFLNNLIAIIEEHLDDPEFGVEKLSSKIAISQSVLYKKLRSLTDMSVNEFIKFIRLKKAAQLLASNQYNVSEVSLMVGFYDKKYFSREFKKQFGKNPSGYKVENDLQ